MWCVLVSQFSTAGRVVTRHGVFVSMVEPATAKSKHSENRRRLFSRYHPVKVEERAGLAGDRRAKFTTFSHREVCP